MTFNKNIPRKKRSPLEGLAAAVKRGEIDLKGPPPKMWSPEERARIDSVRRIHGLFAIIKDAPRTTCLFRMYPWHKDTDFQWIDFGDREPSETFAVHHDGRIVRHTCEYSGHNGDSYGDEYEELTGDKAQKALDGLVGRLEGLAMAAEERRLEEAAARRKAMAAKKNLEARLRSKGVV